MKPQLLSGFAYCAVCGGSLIRSTRHGRRTYRCDWYRNSPGCGSVGILEAELDAHVTDLALRSLANRHEVRRPSAGQRRVLDADRVALAALAVRRFVDRDITEVEYRAARAPLVARSTAAEAEFRLAKRSSRSPRAMADEWARAPLPRRRAMLAQAIERVIVDRAAAGRPRKGIDVRRVTVVFRGTAANAV